MTRMKTIVVKLGSTTVADGRGRLRRAVLLGASCRGGRTDRSRAPGGRRVERGHRLRPERARSARAPRAHGRAAGGVGRRPGTSVRGVCAALRPARVHGRAGPAHQHRLCPAPQLRQRTRHAAPAAGLARRADRQRERHDGHRRDRLRRQRRARGAGGDHAARRPAPAAHRPRRPLHRRSAARSRGQTDRPAHLGRTISRASGGAPRDGAPAA